MKKLLTLLFSILSFAAYSQIGSLAQSGYFSRVQDSAAYVTAAATRHAAGYIDWWCSDSSGLCWVWNGSSYVQWDPAASGGGWPLAGAALFTDDVTIDGAFNIDIGGLTPLEAFGINAEDIQFVATLGDMQFTGTTRIRFTATDSISFVTPGPIRINGDAGTATQVLTSNGSGAPPTWEDPTGGGATAAGATGNVQYKSNGGGLQAEAAYTYDSANNTLTVPSITAGSSTSLTDGAAVTITGTKHTLTSDEATITWTLSQTGDYQTTDIILNATTTTWTFPANTLCVVEGSPSGDNTATLSGTSGDHYILSIYKDGTNYRVVVKNFGQ